MLSLGSNPSLIGKKRVGVDKIYRISEEAMKLKKDEFIQEIKYPSWLANIVMLKKAFIKWRMRVDLTNLKTLGVTIGFIKTKFIQSIN